MARAIVLRGVRHHNLKGFDLAIPHERFVVITGVSGSGKTSLAFDTIYAEGQRRYVESLSSYARQFLELSAKPDVEHIEGLSPSIAIEQRGLNKSPRSIVGTTTEIYDYLRLLFARAGTVHCHRCDRVIEKTPAGRIVEEILRLAGEKLHLIAPVVSGRKGTYEKLFDDLRRDGFVRVIVDGAEYRLDGELPKLDRQKKHDIGVVVDRIVVRDGGDTQRIRASVETALRTGEGKLVLRFGDGREKLFSEQFGCPYCEIYYDEIEPRSFSFNSPAGACPACNGLGFTMRMDERRIVIDPRKPPTRGAIPSLWNMTAQMVEQVLAHYGVDKKTPFDKLPEAVRRAILYGTDEPIAFSVRTDHMKHDFTRPFEGIITALERRYRETTSEMIREELAQYLVEGVCDVCGGKRLQPKALAVRIAGRNIFEMGEMPVEELAALFADPAALGFNEFQRAVAEKPVREIAARLGFLTKVGLGYLTLNRKTATLSGGEAQRIHLATQIGSALTGVTYVLDEPSIGLHAADTAKLISILCALRDQGNTVIVVEHDREIIAAADCIVDLGPGAGRKGGELLYAGPREGLLHEPRSLTGKYLSGELVIEIPEKRRKPAGWMQIRGATANNLKQVSVDIPLGVFCVVTGVSGSGKSSLIMETLVPALEGKPAPLKKFTLDGDLEEFLEIDQSPIGQTPRSNPATYTQAFGPIRDLFAQLPESRARGYRPGRFSFNVKGGRCERCEGAGVIRIEMNFMPDTYITCPDCGGKRFNPDTLEIKYKSKSIYDVLEMEVDEALELFHPFPAIRRKLDLLHQIGLGYLTLGQPAHTLSGGEAQRIKLSKELAKKKADRTLYILDEPTTGLHFDDIKKLLAILNRLVERGASVLIIEHNPDIIKNADYLIDLGPLGGTKGGEIVATGTPEAVAQNSRSLTGRMLKNLL